MVAVQKPTPRVLRKELEVVDMCILHGARSVMEIVIHLALVMLQRFTHSRAHSLSCSSRGFTSFWSDFTYDFLFFIAAFEYYFLLSLCLVIGNCFLSPDYKIGFE